MVRDYNGNMLQLFFLPVTTLSSFYLTFSLVVSVIIGCALCSVLLKNVVAARSSWDIAITDLADIATDLDEKLALILTMPVAAQDH